MRIWYVSASPQGGGFSRIRCCPCAKHCLIGGRLLAAQLIQQNARQAIQTTLHAGVSRKWGAGSHAQSASPAMLLCSITSSLAARDIDGATPSRPRRFISAAALAASASGSWPKMPPSLIFSAACDTAPATAWPVPSTLHARAGQHVQSMHTHSKCLWCGKGVTRLRNCTSNKAVAPPLLY